MNRLDLLKEISFGARVAEEEVSELANYFVETDEQVVQRRGRHHQRRQRGGQKRHLLSVDVKIR